MCVFLSLDGSLQVRSSSVNRRGARNAGPVWLSIECAFAGAEHFAVSAVLQLVAEPLSRHEAREEFLASPDEREGNSV